MRKVKYLGTSQQIGRHGMVKTGSELLLTENEYDTVQDNPEFEWLEDAEPAAEHGGVKTMPQGLPEFDLRKVRWCSDRLHRNLCKLSKSVLMKIATAMREMLIPVKCDRNFDSASLVDSIMYHARREGWTELTRAEIEGCGLFNKREFLRSVQRAKS